MGVLRVNNLTMSLDGFVAGVNQSLEHPLGEGGRALHGWALATRTYRAMFGQPGGVTDGDDLLARRGFEGVGAEIMGRNKFGPVRGEWGDSDWRGWWGDNPPFHHPVFVLTHHPHQPIALDGGTTFFFVTDGIESARERALDAAAGDDVLVGGGAQTVRQYLAAGLIDSMHVAVAPLLLGGGARLFDPADGPPPAYRFADVSSSPAAAHFHLVRDRG